MMVGIFLPLLYLILPSQSWSQNTVYVSAQFQQLSRTNTYPTEYYNRVVIYRQPIASTQRPNFITNRIRDINDDRVVFDGPGRSNTERDSERIVPVAPTQRPFVSSNNQGFSAVSANSPMIFPSSNGQGYAPETPKYPAPSSNSQEYGPMPARSPPSLNNNNRRFSPDTARYPASPSNNQEFASNSARLPTSSSNNQGFSPEITRPSVSTNNNQGFAPEVARSPVSPNINQGFVPENIRPPTLPSNNQRFTPKTTSTTPSPRQTYTTESTNRQPSGSEDQSANAIPNGPSRCVWAIVSCCTPRSTQVRHACFETLGCQGPFWDTNPCDGQITQYAAKAALEFYGTG